MSHIHTVICTILKSAIWKMPIPIPINLGADEWNQVYSVLSMHGLAAFSYEAVAALPDEMRPPREVTMKFISAVVAAEKSYEKLVKVDEKISDLISEAGCKALRLKGLSLAEYYPAHYTRKFVDIDFYAPDKGDLIDAFFRSKGITVDDEFYRHSHCHVHGVLIENHKCLLDVRGRRKMRELDKDLKEMAVAALNVEDQPGMYSPPVIFSAVFNLHHALSHFIYEGISFKFLTDWVYFLRAEREAMSSDEMREHLKKHGLIKFAGMMTMVSMMFLGYPPEWLPKYLIDAAMDLKSVTVKKFVDDLFRPYEPSHYKSKLKERLNNVRKIVKASWKPSEFLGQSSFSFVMDKFIPILLGRKYEAD